MANHDKVEDNKIAFLQIAVDVYNGYKISKDGLSREEDVEVMKGINDEERGFNTGLPLVSRAIRKLSTHSEEEK